MGNIGGIIALLNLFIFICIVLLNLDVEIGVPETVATTVSELNKFE